MSEDVHIEPCAKCRGRGVRFYSRGTPPVECNYCKGVGQRQFKECLEARLEKRQKVKDRRARKLAERVEEFKSAHPEVWIWMETADQCENRHPLIEMNMTREDCLTWMLEHQYPRPPRSACTFCPFHNNAEWRDLRDNQPEAWADAIQVDAEIRNQPKIKAQQFAHAQRIPLADVDLRTLEDHGQLNMFNNECEGMCGL